MRNPSFFLGLLLSLCSFFLTSLCVSFWTHPFRVYFFCWLRHVHHLGHLFESLPLKQCQPAYLGHWMHSLGFLNESNDGHLSDSNIGIIFPCSCLSQRCIIWHLLRIIYCLFNGNRSIRTGACNKIEITLTKQTLFRIFNYFDIFNYLCVEI